MNLYYTFLLYCILFNPSELYSSTKPFIKTAPLKYVLTRWKKQKNAKWRLLSEERRFFKKEYISREHKNIFIKQSEFLQKHYKKNPLLAMCFLFYRFPYSIFYSSDLKVNVSQTRKFSSFFPSKPFFKEKYLKFLSLDSQEKIGNCHFNFFALPKKSTFYPVFANHIISLTELYNFIQINCLGANRTALEEIVKNSIKGYLLKKKLQKSIQEIHQSLFSHTPKFLKVFNNISLVFKKNIHFILQNDPLDLLDTFKAYAQNESFFFPSILSKKSQERALFLKNKTEDIFNRLLEFYPIVEPWDLIIKNIFHPFLSALHHIQKRISYNYPRLGPTLHILEKTHIQNSLRKEGFAPLSEILNKGRQKIDDLKTFSKKSPLEKKEDKIAVPETCLLLTLILQEIEFHLPWINSFLQIDQEKLFFHKDNRFFSKHTMHSLLEEFLKKIEVYNKICPENERFNEERKEIDAFISDPEQESKEKYAKLVDFKVKCLRSILYNTNIFHIADCYKKKFSTIKNLIRICKFIEREFSFTPA